jgi:hypothetical protein
MRATISWAVGGFAACPGRKAEMARKRMTILIVKDPS